MLVDPDKSETTPGQVLAGAHSLTQAKPYGREGPGRWARAAVGPEWPSFSPRGKSTASLGGFLVGPRSSHWRRPGAQLQKLPLHGDVGPWESRSNHPELLSFCVIGCTPGAKHPDPEGPAPCQGEGCQVLGAWPLVAETGGRKQRRKRTYMPASRNSSQVEPVCASGTEHFKGSKRHGQRWADSDLAVRQQRRRHLAEIAAEGVPHSHPSDI